MAPGGGQSNVNRTLRENMTSSNSGVPSIPVTASLAEAMRELDGSQRLLAEAVDGNGNAVGVIRASAIREALFAGVDRNTAIEEHVERGATVTAETPADRRVMVIGGAARNQTYNLEGSEKVTIKAVADAVADLVEGPVKVEHTPARPGDYEGKVVSAKKAMEDLGWVPEVDFLEGLRRTAEWYRATYTPTKGGRV